MRFKVRVTKANGKPEVRKEIAAWVAKKVFPHPTPPEAALLGSSVRNLALTPDPRFYRGNFQEPRFSV
jgi:hypothetical protein